MSKELAHDSRIVVAMSKGARVVYTSIAVRYVSEMKILTWFPEPGMFLILT